MLSLNGRKRNAHNHHLDAVPRAIAHGADDAAQRISELKHEARRRTPDEIFPGTRGKMASRLRTRNDVMLKAQLAKTSRELAHESADIGKAVDTLNAVIRANRRAAAGSRTRLIAGLAAGAALMYHLDPEWGRARREATVRRLRGGSRRPEL